MNEASVLNTNVGGTAGRYIDNPLVPFGMRGFFIFWVSLKVQSCYLHPVDLCGRCETPAGGRDRGDPADALASRRLPEPPAESEVPGVEINRLV